MRITSSLAEPAVLQEIGARIARHRLESGLTQAALAVEAGVAKRTLERIEAGHSAELVTLIRLLRVLNLTDGLEGLVPDQLPSPMALLKSQGRKRRRVRASKANESINTSSRKASTTGLAGTTPAANAPRSKRNTQWTWNE